jgi:hypothetical protein
MKHKKKVVPLATAAVVHGLCPVESGHEHVPHRRPIGFWGLAGKTAVMGTTTPVAGLLLVDLAKGLVLTRPKT